MNASVEPTKNSFPTIVNGFGFSPLAQALWRTDPASKLQFRNLSLDQASADVLMGRHLRAAGQKLDTSAIGDPASSLAFIFVLSGKVTMQEPGQEPVVLDSLSSASRYGTGPDITWKFSHDAEILEIVASQKGQSVLGFDKPTSGKWLLNLEDESNYTMGEGPRKFFKYRDLGLQSLTGRRIHIHVVRATSVVEYGTGWHSHSMGQLFYVLRGTADLAVRKQPWVRMSAGDAMCISPRMPHDVPAFTSDYLVLEMCIPADYDTVDAASNS